jgi:ATP-dependent Clp protease ATP-binding subunit ClpA
VAEKKRRYRFANRKEQIIIFKKIDKSESERYITKKLKKRY